ILVRHAEIIQLAIIQLADATILGYPVNPESWTLTSDEVLRLGSREALPVGEPSAQAWVQAWREWCQPVRGASPEDVSAAKLEPASHRLVARVSPRLLEKLKVSRPEAFRGDGWLVAGAGPISAAAEVEVRSN